MGLAGTLARQATAPVRLGLTAGEMALEVALGLVRGTRRVLDGDHRKDHHPFSQWATPPSRRPRAGVTTAPSPSPTSGGTRPTTEAPVTAPPPRRPKPVKPPPPVPPSRATGPAVPVVPPPRGAKQVDDTPVPVAEFGEEGAEDEAGSQVRIDPPWNGYDDMTAAQMQQRLGTAKREVVAAVSLYEGSHRKRRTVIDAAGRRLRSLSV